MKWFRHFSDAHQHPKIKKLLREFGSDGYYVCFVTLEIISYYGNDFRLSFKKFSSQEFPGVDKLGQEKVEKVWERMIEYGLLDGKSYKRGYLYSPKLKEYADFYSKYLKATKKQLKSDLKENKASEVEEEVEEEEKKEKKETKEKKEKKESSFLSFSSQAINYLNDKTGKRFSPKNKATARFLRARFNEGRTLGDIKAVIDNRVSKWAKDERMVEYLRPSTLFNATNFENYLAEARRISKEPEFQPSVGLTEEEKRKAQEELAKRVKELAERRKL